MIVKSCVSKSTEIADPSEAETSKLVTRPVNPEPSPTNEPVNEPVASTPVNVKPAIEVTVSPSATGVDPMIDPEFVRAVFGISLKLASTTLIPSAVTEIVLSEAETAN